MIIIRSLYIPRRTPRAAQNRPGSGSFAPRGMPHPIEHFHMPRSLRTLPWRTQCPILHSPPLLSLHLAGDSLRSTTTGGNCVSHCSPWQQNLLCHHHNRLTTGSVGIPTSGTLGGGADVWHLSFWPGSTFRPVSAGWMSGAGLGRYAQRSWSAAPLHR
jgi:hypothetical protein